LTRQELRIILKTQRAKKGLSHKAIAEKISISRQYYGMIENGVRSPSIRVAKKLGRVLEVSWTIFFDIDGNI